MYISMHNNLYFITWWVKVDGNLYKPDNRVNIGARVEDDLPVVGKFKTHTIHY